MIKFTLVMLLYVLSIHGILSMINEVLFHSLWLVNKKCGIVTSIFKIGTAVRFESSSFPGHADFFDLPSEVLSLVLSIYWL